MAQKPTVILLDILEDHFQLISFKKKKIQRTYLGTSLCCPKI